jgi:hypothetical protein
MAQKGEPEWTHWVRLDDAAWTWHSPKTQPC